MAATDQQPPAGDREQITAVAGAARHWGPIRQLLELLLLEDRQAVQQLVVGNFDRRESVLIDSPSARGKRLLIPRPGQGGDTFPVTTTAATVIAQNEGRLGGSIGNRGPDGVILYLATLGDMNQPRSRPALWLPPNASWDFRLADILYGGEVVGATVQTTATLTVAEF